MRSCTARASQRQRARERAIVRSVGGLVERGPFELGEGARVRRARPADLDAVLTIRRGVALPSDPRQRGDSFLLGSEAEGYASLLDARRMWLLEREDQPVGFTVTLSDALLRETPLWRERARIEWHAGERDPNQLEGGTAYFDQLAVLPARRQRRWSACLALCALAELVADEAHARVWITTVLEPVVNRAALPYLSHLGAREIGRLDEHYPEVGAIVSALHAVEAQGYWSYAAALAGRSRPSIEAVLAGVARAAEARDALLLNP